ncbi:MAG TPA: hypothetical protein VLW50_09875 [Streptosporangiaceae bacterium]|nr:hypothetical protein [Streptosporangiaceae bacterium]
MIEQPIEDVPGVSRAAHKAAAGTVVYLTEGGKRFAAIVPAALAERIAGLPADALADLLEDFDDAAYARAARVRAEAGEPLIPWADVRARAGL